MYKKYINLMILDNIQRYIKDIVIDHMWHIPNCKLNKEDIIMNLVRE